MRHRIKTEKPKEIIKESDIKQATKYSYKTIIPKEVIEVFPQLKEDAKIVYHIKQTSLTEFECDITFKAKGITIQDDKNPASNIENAGNNNNESETTADSGKSEAGNTIDVEKFKDVKLQDGKYTVKVTNPSTPKLRIVGDTVKEEIKENRIIKDNEIGMSVARKSEDEVRAIIQDIQSIENVDVIKIDKYIDQYRQKGKRQYND